VSPIELLSRLRERRVQVIADGDRLRVRAPEGALSPELKAELASQKAAILAVLKGAAAYEAVPTPGAAFSADDVPLSFAQERFWFLEQLEHGTSAHHLVFGIRFEGALDERAVRDALQRLVDRHAALRTSFVDDHGRPRQVVAADAAADVRLIDLGQHPESARFSEALRAAHAASREVFDLGRAPLMRNLLLRLSPLDHVLVFVFHHIVSDGWSAGIVMRDFAEAYRAGQAGASAPLPGLPVQYADFAARQRQSFASGAFAAQSEYWKKQLSALPALNLPTDRPRPAVLTVRGAEYRFLIDKELSESLVRLSHREGVTLFMTTLAGFEALLHRYSQQDEFAVGTAIAGRNAAEFEDVVGPFINTLVLRSNLQGNPTFREVLRRVRDTSLDAYANQDLPFEKLVDELQPERDLSRNALYQVIFALQNVPVPDVRLDGLTLSVVPLERVTAALDLDWILYPTLEGLHGTVRYSTDLFDAATIERMTRHYISLLAAAAADAGRRLADLPMLAPEERAQLDGWNETASSFARETPVHQSFAAQVSRTPDRTALEWRGGRLSYRQLDARANAFARRLLEGGIRPDDRVAVVLERSADFVAAALGVMKAGAAYLPIETSCPIDRLTFMLQDAAARMVITTQALAPQLRAAGAVAITPGEIGGPADAAEAPVVSVDAANLAYVIYTSGSTGLPKGVALSHSGLQNLVAWHRRAYAVADDDRAALVAGLGFDASVWELWPYLLCGACVCIPDDDTRISGPLLLEWLAASAVSVCFVPTPMAEAMFACEMPADLAVRAMLVGGDTLHGVPAGLSFTVYNNYGPTESTVVTSWIEVPGGTTVPPPIGFPVDNTRIHVLDRQLTQVPIGVPGELYVAGDSLARGYLARPDLTASRFVPDPFAPQPGGRMYRTGDAVRRLPSGALEFLGRLDNQVKIRGFRIELGEIETVLARHPAVRDAVVVARQGRAGNPRLVAYVTAHGTGIDSAALTRHLKNALPDYMVPSAVVVLDALPLTPNGKIDRAALPEPAAPVAEDRPASTPSTAVEQSLAGIWARVLRLARVGVDDNFFELGGDSILSLQVVAGARDAGFKVTPRQIFEHPTIAELARVARVSGSDERATAAESESGDVFLTPIQRWFFEQAPGHPEHFNHAVLLRSAERLDPALVREAASALMARHDALRLRFAPNGDGQWHPSYAADNDLPFVTVDLAAEPAAIQVATIERTASELQASLDLQRGPILRVGLFDLGTAGSRVLLIVHHLAIDAVSWRIVMGDLQTAYRQRQQGQPIALSPATTSFKTWSRRLAAQAQRAAAEASVWTPLADLAVEPCPVDHPEGENTCASESTVETWLEPDQTRALIQDTLRKYGMRMHEAVLAAVAAAWADWTAQAALLVDVESHGREAIADDVDLSDTVGWFTSMYPVAFDLTRTKTVGDQLKRVKEQLRRVPQGGLSYGLLRYLGPDAALRRQLEAIPTPDVSFNFLGQFDGVFSGQLLTPALEPIGPLQAPDNLRAHLVEVSARVLEGRLHVAWHYSRNLHERATIERLASRFAALVRDIVAHCQSDDAGGFTPSDFPLAKVSQDQLDRLMARIGAGGKS
jgi:amino acid adenylation domain-containing protein/non-ribosomal peptide synthase protein (TIGR01720 family)